MREKKIVVAITGASGAILGIRLLEELKKAGVHTHLVLSSWAERTIAEETDYSLAQVTALAGTVHNLHDLAASISSGSFKTDGMAIVPCSMKTLAAIACGLSDNLIARAADVTIKEKRHLVLMTRETPLSTIHLRNMQTLAKTGAMILPPCVGFYTKPETLEDVINHLVGKVLDSFHIDNQLFKRWKN